MEEVQLDNISPVSETRNIEHIPPQNNICNVINMQYPGALVEETDHPEFGIVTHKDKEMLLFIKTIVGEVAFYNMKISRNAFGPELIHEDDFKYIQQTMKQMNIDKCIYVIYSSDKKIYAYQHTFPLDEFYLEWLTEEA